MSAFLLLPKYEKAMDRIATLERELAYACGKHIERDALDEQQSQATARLVAERDAWHDIAKQHCRNEQFYHGLLDAVGQLFGDAAKRQDDGGLCEDVLALRVHECVYAALAELAEARKALANACDAARDFPAHTCPASRHVQQMAEALMSGGYPMLADEPKHCAESMLATVRALWDARKDAERYRWWRVYANDDSVDYTLLVGCNTPEELDAAIDAARASAPT